MKMRAFCHRFGKNREGVTAVEFGLVAFPFFLFVLGTLAIGLQFFTINLLDQAVERAARQIRTGQAQRSLITLQEFKERVCAEGGYYLENDCENIRIHVQNATNWADIVPRACAENGVLTDQANMAQPVADQSGGSQQVVLVTVCYNWEMPLTFPYLNYMMMRPADGVPLISGGSLLQSVATFRTEPY